MQTTSTPSNAVDEETWTALEEVQNAYDKIHSDLQDTKVPKVAKRVKFLKQIRDEVIAIEYGLPSEGQDRLRAVLESIRYNVHLELNLMSNFSMMSFKRPARLSRILTSFWIYDLVNKRFLSKPADEIFGVAWDGEDFVSLQYDATEDEYSCEGTSNRYVVLCKDLQFLRERQLVDKFHSQLQQIKEYPFNDISVVLVNGVPGCGKTTEILRSHTSGVDLVCTTTRNANEDYIKAMKSRNKSYYRTFDSALLNPLPQADRLWADEGLMTHAGELLLVGMLCSAKEIRIFGDSKQIPFINRAVGFTMTHSILNIDKTEYRNTTYRLPKCMTPIMRNFYPLYDTQSKVAGSVKVVPVKSAVQIDYEADINLTFTRYEKQLVISFSDKHGNTIHEVQGATYNHVNVIRLVVQDDAIYQSLPHIVVALSRHRISLTYYTVNENDTLSKLINGAKLDLTEEIDLEALLGKYKPTPILPCIQPGISRSKIVIEGVKTWTPLIDFIKHKLGCQWQSNLSYVIERPYVADPLDTNDELDVDIGATQGIYDLLYDRPDYWKRTSLLSELTFPLNPAFIVNYPKLLTVSEKTEVYCIPKLITVQPDRYTGGIKETIVAIEKRNMNPPVLHLTRYSSLAKEVCDVFMNTYIDDKKLEAALNRHKYENAVYFEDWMRNRAPEQVKSMEGYELKDYDPNIYSAHVKPDHKPKLDGTHNVELVAGQTIGVHHPMNTARFSGPFKCFQRILLESLKDKWLINDGVNSNGLNGFINKFLHSKRAAKILEIDFSKFDKSQEDIILAVTCLILNKLGMPSYIIDEWTKCHQSNMLIFFSVGLTVRTKFQRKSGDAFTFIGNTLVSMFVISYVYNLDEAYGGIFGGDDSIVLFPEEYPIDDKTGIMSDLFNLVAKVEWFEHAPMFCSKFLVFANGVYYWVPDPIKAITRLGRKDLYCKEHIEYYYISFKDNMKAYLNSTVRSELIKKAEIRYARYFKTKNVDLTMIVNFIASVVRSKQKFLSMYHAPSAIWNRPLKPTLKNAFTREAKLLNESGMLIDLIYGYQSI